MAHYQDGGYGYASNTGAGQEARPVGSGGGYSGMERPDPRASPNHLYHHQQQQRFHDPRQTTRNNTLPPEIRPLNNARYYGGHSREPSLRRIASVDHNLYNNRRANNTLHHNHAGQLSPGFGAFPRGPPPQHHNQQPHPQTHPPAQQRHGDPTRSNEVLSEESMTDDDYYDESEFEGSEAYPGDYSRVTSGYSQNGYAANQGGYLAMERRGTPGLPLRAFSPVGSGPPSRAGSAMGNRASPNTSRMDLPSSLLPGPGRQRISNGSVSSGKGLKMPLAFNMITRGQEGVISGGNGDLYASPTSSPTSSYAPSPSTPGFPPPDFGKQPSSQPSNEYMRKQLFPNAPDGALPAALEVPPDMANCRIPSMNFSRFDGRTSFRSAVTTDRSSMVSQSSGMFTVDEAIGMYGSETDSDDEVSKLGASLTLEEQKILLEQEFQKDAMAAMRQSLSQQSERSRASSGPSLLDRTNSISSRRAPPSTTKSGDASAETSPISPSETSSQEKQHQRQKSSLHTIKVDQSETKEGTDVDEFPMPPAPTERSDSPNDQEPPPPVDKEPPKPVAKEPPKPFAKDNPRAPAPPPRDRYGFKKQTTNVSLAEYDAWNATYEEAQARRRLKWESLMREAGLQIGENGPTRFPPKSQKLKRYVRKGIPPEWRGAAWFWFAGGPSILAKNHGLYAKILEGRDLASAPDYEIIERDLHRTFPDNIHFKPDPEVGADGKPNRQSKIVETPILRSLRRVLVAFSLHVPKVGYCQSLNFLAGLLLLFMDEEKAFWMLFIITQHLLPGTHDLNLGSDIDQGVLMLCIRDSLPVVWSKIGHNVDGVLSNEVSDRLPPVALVTLAWFMNAFLCNLPIETALRVWDCWFYEGPKTLFRISLAILKMGEDEIRKVNENGEAIQLVQNLPRKMIDPTALMELCFKRRNGFGHLSQADVDQKREERRRVHMLVSREGARSARPGSRAKSKTQMRNYARDDSSVGNNYNGSSSSRSRFLRGITGKA